MHIVDRDVEHVCEQIFKNISLHLHNFCKIKPACVCARHFQQYNIPHNKYLLSNLSSLFFINVLLLHMTLQFCHLFTHLLCEPMQSISFRQMSDASKNTTTIHIASVLLLFYAHGIRLYWQMTTCWYSIPQTREPQRKNILYILWLYAIHIWIWRYGGPK